MDENEMDPSDLNDEQRARAEALVLAGRILGKRPGVFNGGGGVAPDWDTSDLTDLAEYVLKGTHPLAAYREATMTPIRLEGVLDETTESWGPGLVGVPMAGKTRDEQPRDDGPTGE